MKLRLTVGALVLSVAATAALAAATLGGAGTSTSQRTAALDKGALAAVAIVEAGSGNLVANDGFLYATHPSTGIYCLRAKASQLKPTKRVALLTVEWGRSGGNDLSAFWNSGSSNCTFPEYEVQTYSPSTGTLNDDTTFVIAIP